MAGAYAADMTDSGVDISLLIPYSNENRWSDVLATMITADPSPLVELGLLPREACATGIRVVREVSANREGGGLDRIDLKIVAADDGAPLLAIECKVLSGLGPRQLLRYTDTHGAPAKIVLTLPHVHLDKDLPKGWEQMTWPTIIGPFTRSTNAWARMTARAWTEHLTPLQELSGSTRWNSLVVPSRNGLHDLQVKTDFLLQQPGHGFRLGNSSASAKPLIYLTTALPSWPGSFLHVEVEDAEGRTMRPEASENGEITGGKGLRALISIRQDLTADDPRQPFDWEPLVRAWPVLEASSMVWTRSGPRPSKKRPSSEVQELDRLRAEGFLPRHAGQGFRQDGEYVEYGVRTSALPMSSTLDEITTFLRQLSALADEVVAALEPSA